MLEIGAANAGRTFRAKRQVVAAAILEAVDLLVDDVGAFGAGAEEDADVLEHRRLDLAVAVGLRHAHRGIAQPAPVGLVCGQDVGDAARRSVAARAWHKPSSGASRLRATRRSCARFGAILRLVPREHNEYVIDEIRAAPGRLHATRSAGDRRQPRAAVLMPLLHHGDEMHVVFTKRTDHVQHHRGEISFPGGAMDRKTPT